MIKSKLNLRPLYLFALFFVGFTAILHAENTISGWVKEKGNNKGVHHVSVSVVSGDNGKILGGTFTDEKGYFQVRTKEDVSKVKVVILFNHLSYKKLTKTDLGSVLNGQSFLLEPRTEKLKEVIVHSKPVRQRGDTISYSVNQLKALGDRSLEDVLKRIPGMSIDTSGKIRYQGKDLSRLYVEGMDLMGGRYSQVTKNLTTDDVASVELLENHEAIKMDKEISRSKETALNIRLTEKAKLNWIYSLETGAGINVKGKPQYLIEGSASSFGKKSQTMLIGKGNNEGKEIMSEMNRFGFDGSSWSTISSGQSRGGDLFATSAELGDNIVRAKGRINQSATGSANHIRKFSEDAQWRVNLNYGFDNADRHALYTTLFRTSPTEQTKIEEEKTLSHKHHKLSVESNYTFNGKSRYTRVKTEFSLLHKELQGEKIANRHPYDELTKAPSGTLSNDFEWSKKFGKGRIRFSDNLFGAYRPHSLALHAPNGLSDGATDILQKIETKSFGNAASLSYFYTEKGWELNLGVNADLNREELSSSLTGLKFSGTHPTSGSITYQEAKTTLTPSLAWNYKYLRLSFTPAVTWMLASSDEQGSKDKPIKISQNDIRFNPSFYLKYEPSSRFYTTLGLSRSESDGSYPLSLYTPYLFRGIGSIGIGEPAWWKTKASSAWLYTVYKDVLNFFSASYNLRYANLFFPRSSSHFLDGVYIISKPDWRATHSESFSQSLSAQKSFRSIGLTTNLELNHSISKGKIIQQEKVFNHQTQSLLASPMVEWLVSSKLSFKYSGNYSLSLFELKDGGKESSKQINMYHSFSMYARPTSLWTLKASANMYDSRNSSIENGKRKGIWFFDGESQYVFPWATMVLTIRNLGQNDIYRVESQNGLNVHSSTFFLRPSEILLSFRWNLAKK
ncbi:MAG: hypothetical protein Q3998_03750 [Porphyromonas sp.]|nr:hypothetical protein [Porphyromonas sp.]